MALSLKAIHCIDLALVTVTKDCREISDRNLCLPIYTHTYNVLDSRREGRKKTIRFNTWKADKG